MTQLTKNLLIIFCIFAYSSTLIGQEKFPLSQITEENVYITYGGYENTKAYLKMQLVSEDTYNKELKNAVNYLIQDTLKIKKVNSTFKLPITRRSVKYEDDLSVGGSYAIYKYLGQIEFLNAYIVEVINWESSSYVLIDKTFGTEIDRFEEYPLISKNKDYIAVVQEDAYEMLANLTLYSIKGREIENMSSDNFENWVPYPHKEVFWSNNYLYVPAVHIDAYNSDKELGEHCQYIRIEIINVFK